VLSDAGHVLHWTHAITAQMPSPDIANTLDLPDGVPLLIHTRTTHDDTDRPLLLEETHLPGHRVSIGGRTKR
jgi:DNA-binding GntR family transcriptional regulator